MTTGTTVHHQAWSVRCLLSLQGQTPCRRAAVHGHLVTVFGMSKPVLSAVLWDWEHAPNTAMQTWYTDHCQPSAPWQLAGLSQVEPSLTSAQPGPASCRVVRVLQRMVGRPLLSRSRPEPGPAADPAQRGARYWHFTVNELGIQDMEAQVERIHCVKSAELGPQGKGLVHGPLASGFLPAPSMNAATLEAALGYSLKLGTPPPLQYC